MTEVQYSDFYEWPFNNDTAICEECGKDIEVPNSDDLNAGMKEPFWMRFGDVFRSYCEPCFSEKFLEVDN